MGKQQHPGRAYPDQEVGVNPARQQKHLDLQLLHQFGPAHRAFQLAPAHHPYARAETYRVQPISKAYAIEMAPASRILFLLLSKTSGC